MLPILWTLLFLCVVDKTLQDGCPGGWIETRSGSCVKVFNTYKTWRNARKECQKYGSDLIMLLDDEWRYYQQVIERIVDRFRPDLKDDRFWIGLNDIGQRGRFKWLDETGEAQLQSEPIWPHSLKRSDEKCVFIEYWLDELIVESCHFELYFICEGFPEGIRGTGYKENYTTTTENNVNISEVSSTPTPKQSTMDLGILETSTENMINENNNTTAQETTTATTTERFNWSSTYKPTKGTVGPGTQEASTDSMISENYNITAHTNTTDRFDESPTYKPTKATVGSDSCTVGWILFASSRSCIKFFQHPKSWRSSRRFCKLAGGDLLAIRSQKMNNFIAECSPLPPGTIHPQQNVALFPKAPSIHSRM
ncbi:macrophage mannose receptor 1 [Elysia marginata]|uniref:Macrophage mannose receptor 1 n=1 Tax=Elysia marginata TaxID=1093978 RepID=A0AAV4IFP0_9GAST|nr:macrophage mannose receptor 1 [Elysia marginata]